MFSLLSKREARKSILAPENSPEFGRLRRAAFTFDSQQVYEDQPWSTRPDDEESAPGKPNLVVPHKPGVPDVKVTPLREVKTPSIVPSIIIISDDDSSSDTIVAPSERETRRDDDDKESYEFLNNDGRWHHKPHVYEYNEASTRLIETARPNLFGTIRQSDRACPKKFVLNVARMQAMVIRTYQREIMEAGKEMMDGKMSVLLPQLLHKYCEALRDMDYIEEKAANGFDDDPFLLQTSKQMERDLMEDQGLIPEHMEPRGELPKAFDWAHPRLPGVGRTDRIHKAQLQNKYHKFYSALGGGLALAFR